MPYSPLAMDITVHRLANGTEAMGDFVNSNGSTPKQELLINTNRILHSGIDMYFEIASDLKPIPENTVEAWKNQLSFQANLS